MEMSVEDYEWMSVWKWKQTMHALWWWYSTNVHFDHEWHKHIFGAIANDRRINIYRWLKSDLCRASLASFSWEKRIFSSLHLFHGVCVCECQNCIYTHMQVSNRNRKRIWRSWESAADPRSHEVVLTFVFGKSMSLSEEQTFEGLLLLPQERQTSFILLLLLLRFIPSYANKSADKLLFLWPDDEKRDSLIESTFCSSVLW